MGKKLLAEKIHGLYKYQVRAAEKKAVKALKKKQREVAKKAKEAEKEAAIKAKKAAREKQLKGAKVTTEKGVKVTKYPFDESAVEKAQTHVGRDWKHKHLDQLDWKKGGAVHTMPDGRKMKGAKHGMKHGGAVKGKCKVDGIAIRGRTRAKHK